MQRVKTSAILLSLFLFATNLLAVQATQVAELKNIDFTKKGDQIEVIIEYPSNIPYDSFSLEIKPPDGPVLPIERTVPGRVNQYVNLY